MTTKETIRRATGLEPDEKCARCGITARESYDNGPYGSSFRYPYGFYIVKNEYVCPRCHREIGLEKLFKLMDEKGM